MRGKVHKLQRRLEHVGITPAHAGKRSDKTLEDFRGWDHPRPCGEKVTFSTSFASNAGSPPPMRGKVQAARQVQRNGGITPAHAGKSMSYRLQYLLTSDHPRPCGEKPSRAMYLTTALGSPPPMRGKETPKERRAQKMRITPAHAGKRWRVRLPSSPWADHPRPCGEKFWRFRWPSWKKGSPPPMRGKVPPRLSIPNRTWITPAHAGKSGTKTLLYPCMGDHPRPCGEKKYFFM